MRVRVFVRVYKAERNERDVKALVWTFSPLVVYFSFLSFLFFFFCTENRVAERQLELVTDALPRC